MIEFSRVLVLVTGDPSDEGAVSLAASLVRGDHRRLLIVYVIVIDRSQPVDSEVTEKTLDGEQVLERAEQTAHIPRNIIDTQLLQAREVGPAVVHEAIVRDVDAIVLGTSYPTMLGAFSLGRDIPYILERAPCHVMLWREPLSGVRPELPEARGERSASRIG